MWLMRAVDVAVVVFFGLAVGQAVWHIGGAAAADKRSAVQHSISDTGRLLIADIERVSTGAVLRGRLIAHTARVIEALATGDRQTLTMACNDAVRGATEIDAVTVFDSSGHILAMNTVYADGTAVPAARLERVLRRDFSDRSVIARCVVSAQRSEVVEFQAACDITLALFDCSGLTVAHSVPVHDRSGAQIGVISTRMRFERVSELVAGRDLADGRGVARLVTDAGGFVDEQINTGGTPPVPEAELKSLIAPLVNGGSESVAFEREGMYHAVFRMSGIPTVEHGGIQAMISVPASWANREAILASIVAIGTPLSLALLMLLARSLARASKESTRHAERALDAIREAGALRATLRRHSIYSVADADGRILDVNDKFCAVSGCTRERLLGENHRSLSSGVQMPEFWQEMWRTLASGSAWRGEICNRGKDGTLVWLDTIIAPFCNADGVIEKYVFIENDISARKLAEEQATAAKDFMHSAINALDSQTVVLDAEGYICAFNDAWAVSAERGGGDPKAVLSGANYLRECERAAGQCEQGAAVAEAIRCVIASDVRPASIEYPCHSSKERHWFTCSVRGFMNAGRRFVAVTHTDITTLKFAEADLRAVNRDLREAKRLAQSADQAKSDFLANMSHEMRTPLTAIMGYADLLCDNEASGADGEIPRAESAQIIRRAGAHLLMVINDILDLSKIDSDNMQLERIATPGARIIQEVAELLRLKAETKSVRFTTSLDSAIPSLMYSDPTRLRQIIMNLAGNAVKFTDAGVVSISARVDEGSVPSRLMIDVCDTGPGLNAEEVAGLFKPFTQGDNTVTRRHGGTGLGLAISRKLARMMKGDVELVRSISGEGSCFRLWIPIDPVPGAPDVNMLGSPSALAPRSASGEAAARPDGAAGKQDAGRIILAEDGIDNQRLIAHLLRSAGFTVEVADNGRIALTSIRAKRESGTPFDLILTDMQMPEMDGYALATALRQEGFTTPVIALTAHAMAGDRDRCAAAGCDDYVTKPVDKRTLLATCRKWLKAAAGLAA